MFSMEEYLILSCGYSMLSQPQVYSIHRENCSRTGDPVFKLPSKSQLRFKITLHCLCYGSHGESLICRSQGLLRGHNWKRLHEERPRIRVLGLWRHISLLQRILGLLVVERLLRKLGLLHVNRLKHPTVQGIGPTTCTYSPINVLGVARAQFPAPKYHEPWTGRSTCHGRNRAQ
jgi:hypothetical protein